MKHIRGYAVGMYMLIDYIGKLRRCEKAIDSAGIAARPGRSGVVRMDGSATIDKSGDVGTDLHLSD
jgi:hypothetical protein